MNWQRAPHVNCEPARKSDAAAQALNNWGLVLQELSAMGGPGGGRERGALVAASVAKFRGAIRLRPEFDRACYNLGTVYYSHAHALQAAAQSALSSQLTKARRLTPQVARAFQGFQGVLGLGFQVSVNVISDSCCGCAAHHAREGSMAR